MLYTTRRGAVSGFTLKALVNTVGVYLRVACFFGCSGSQKTRISCVRAGFVFFYEDTPGAVSF